MTRSRRRTIRKPVTLRALPTDTLFGRLPDRRGAASMASREPEEEVGSPDAAQMVVARRWLGARSQHARFEQPYKAAPTAPRVSRGRWRAEQCRTVRSIFRAIRARELFAPFLEPATLRSPWLVSSAENYRPHAYHDAARSTRGRRFCETRGRSATWRHISGATYRCPRTRVPLPACAKRPARTIGC
jgi:hypothetical protein